MSAILRKNYLGSIFEVMSSDHNVLEIIKSEDNVAEVTSHESGWYSFYLISETPLVDDDYDKLPPYKYSYVIRTSKSSKRFLLVSTHEALNGIFLDKVNLKGAISSVKIHVSDLVSTLSESPDIYCLGVVFAKVDGYGRSLRSVSLYGNDLAQAKLFRDILPKLVAYRTHLKEVRSGKEILQVGSKGEIGFFLRDLNSLHEVDRAIRFLNEKGFLLWDFSSDMLTEDQIND